MILQALNDYYHRKSSDSEAELAPPGFQHQEIPFIIVLDDQGRFIGWEDYRESEGRNKRVRSFLVPQAVKKSVNIAANLLWGGLNYALGEDIKENPKRVAKSHQAFLEKIKDLLPLAEQDEGLMSVIAFLESSSKDQVRHHSLWPEILKTTSNISFRLASDNCLICQRPAVQQAIKHQVSQKEGLIGLCLVTGENTLIERLHPAIKGVPEAQTSGANVVSFNKDSFCSYGKEQGNNAPIGTEAVFAYTTALNHLLKKDSQQKLQVGDATTVFWTEKKHSKENLLVDLFGHPPKDDPDRNTRAVRSLYEAPKTGAPPLDEDPTRFFVLGLSPNAARLSVRFWQVATIGELARNIRQHFKDIEIVHAPYELKYLPLWQLLRCTALQEDSKNIVPNLAGEVMRSILLGTPYPRTLLSVVLARIQAEQAKKDKKGRPAPNVSYPRAAWIKAYLNRYIRRHKQNEKEIAVCMDENNPNTAYRLGRLFAVLEKAQEDANPGINTTIRDRFYGAASTRPATIFPILLRLYNHHISKLRKENRWLALKHEKQLQNIANGFNDFPATLILEDQGKFGVGYYHQRQQFFNKCEHNEQGE